MSPIRSLFRSLKRPLLRTSIAGAAALALALLATDLPVRGVSTDVVISQVYGAGGNSGALLKNDFVELFNRGTAPVSLSGWSIQYASATGTGNFSSNPITTLSGVLQPGQYYLVQLAGGANGSSLPAADATGTVNMSGTAGKVALVRSTSGLACNGGSTACSAAQLAQIADLVGWGTANFFEGAVGPATSTILSIFRASDGCIDTDNNSADFTAATPAPRNTGSTFKSCSGPTPPHGDGLATPASVTAGDSSLLTVTVTPGANPPSTGLGVTVDLSQVGLTATQTLYDDGTHGDATAGDNVFSYSSTVPAAASTGALSLPFIVSDAQSRSDMGFIALAVAPAPISIHDIQGPGLASPYAGQLVTTRGVVTARRYNNGFFIQVPDSLVDGDTNTSEGVLVYTGGAPPASAAIGAYVQVTGTVSEYVPGADPYSPPMTEITSPTVTARPESFPMPAAVTLTATDLPTTGTLEQLERFEGMRVFVPALRVVSPTAGSVNTGNATASSNGVFYAVIDGTARPFREPGVQVLDALPAGSPANVPRFDFNPERLRVDSDGQYFATRIEVTTGALLSNVYGVLDYAYRTWTVLPDAGSPPAVSPGMAATAAPAPNANEFTVASLNLQGFSSTAAGFSKRLNKASLAIRTMGRYPDILGIEEATDLVTLQTLATRVNADAVTAGDADPGYTASLFEGNDPSGIDVGFLVKSSRVTVVDVVQEGKDATFTKPDGNQGTLNDRPPLVLTAEVHGPTGTLPVTVIVNHLRSLGDVDSLTDGFARAKRLAQAEFLAKLIQARQEANPQERIISVGDYNAYEVNDGYVDVMGIIEGKTVPADQVVLAGTDGLVDPPLTDLVTTMDATDRYSYSYDGSAQVLDHILVNDAAKLRFSRMHYARFDADFPESARGDQTTPMRLSDHDMAVAYFVFPSAPVLHLTGTNPMTVECCSTYTDPGATASDDDWGDLTSLIQVTGTVDAHTVGSYTVTYSVSNGYTTSSIDRTVNVVDTTAPALTLLGQNPMTVEVGSVFVDPGATASDACAGDLTGAIAVTGGVDPAVVGTYQIKYSVSDGYNTTELTRTVNVVDTTPPTLSAVVPTFSFLWPVNHKFVAVGLGYTVADNSGSATCTVGIVSNEPVNGTGDGDTAPDWLVISATSVQLRAERAGTGSGRVYTMTVTCRDASNNSTTGQATVNVPKSQGK